MASSDGGQDPRLKQKLLTQSKSFSFYQAVRLLRALAKKENKTLKITPLLSQSFPGADIDAITEEESHYELVATFLGLYSVDSPLPAYYVEELIAQVNEDNLTCKAFLDIFHQHLYEMLYAVWAKYRLSHQIAEENNHHLLQIIYNLAGLGFTHQPALLKENSDWAKYIRFFMAGNRNLTNLQELLTDYFATAVKIESFYPALIAIHPEQKNQLGVLQSTLGNFYLGEYFQSATTNLLLSFRELTQQQALLFMQNGKNSQQLKTLLNTYLITPYNFFIELQFDSAAPMPTALGGHARLGQTTQMGVPLGPRLTRVTYLL